MNFGLDQEKYVEARPKLGVGRSSLLDDDNAETVDITTVAGHQEVSNSLRQIMEDAMRVRAEVTEGHVAAATK